eukprot:COSAG05_NODE_1520_length_4645_cov_613.938187_6_plen_228_part_00
MSRAEIETFKREGAVVLKRFIPQDQVAEWTKEYWDFMGANPDAPETWPGAPRFDLGRHFSTEHATNLGGQVPGSLTAGAGFRPGTINPSATRLTDLPSVQALAQQLGGGGVSAPFPFDGHLIPRFPQKKEWREPVRGFVACCHVLLSVLLPCCIWYVSVRLASDLAGGTARLAHTGTVTAPTGGPGVSTWASAQSPTCPTFPTGAADSPIGQVLTVRASSFSWKTQA